MLPTIDQLREQYIGQMFYHGLGMIKFRIDDRFSYHFYSDDTPPIVDGIHDHHYNFKSDILMGIIKNYVYSVDGQDPNSTLRVEQGRGSLTGQQERVVVLENANLVELFSFERSEGESYNMAYDTFHCVETITDKVVTLIDTEIPFAQPHTNVIINTTKENVGAFSQPKSTDRCWEIIEDILKG